MKRNMITEKLSDYPLRKALYEKFGSKLSDEVSDYKITEQDLKTIYDIVNKIVFNSELIDNIEIQIIDRTNEMAKGVIGFKIDNKTSKKIPLIKIIREENMIQWFL